MSDKKLSLHDFEAVRKEELLEIKGGYRPHVNHSRHAIFEEASGGGGGGGANGCPKCKDAFQKNGTPIPNRCNGANHFSGSLAAAWNRFWSWENAIATGSTASPYASIGAAGSGYMNDPYQQFKDYYNNYDPTGSSQTTSMPSRAQIISAMNTCAE